MKEENSHATGGCDTPKYFFTSSGVRDKGRRVECADGIPSLMESGLGLSLMVESNQERLMKFMISWKILPAHHTVAAKGFLSSGAPMPPGLKQLGRWHGPGSVKGWALVECEDPSALYQHAAVWADRLETEVIPVVEDAEAAEALVKVFKD